MNEIMVKVFVKDSDIYKMVEEENRFRPNQKVIGWHFSGDEIVFDTNRRDHATEHYNLIEFVATVCRHFKSVNDMKCNQFKPEIHGKSSGMSFYRDEGATDCHSIPENLPTYERANIRIDWRVDSFSDGEKYDVPEEVANRMLECRANKPYFDLKVLQKVDEMDVPLGQKRKGENCVYWIISDEQMKRIEYTMLWRNQFAKVYQLSKDGKVRGYMDGILFTDDGKRILLGSDADTDMFTSTPAYAHVGLPSAEDTHACRLG